jgi:hypothetical protein
MPTRMAMQSDLQKLFSLKLQGVVQLLRAWPDTGPGHE